MIYETSQGPFLFSTDRSKLQISVIHHYLSQESYWARNIPLETVEACLAGSLCFGVYAGQQQIGFARVITDLASFGYLADVFILEAYRGQGLSKALLRFILGHTAIKQLRRFMLATKDAHGLYEQFGFQPLSEPDRFMEIKPFESYPPSI